MYLPKGYHSVISHTIQSIFKSMGVMESIAQEAKDLNPVYLCH